MRQWHHWWYILSDRSKIGAKYSQNANFCGKIKLARLSFFGIDAVSFSTYDILMNDRTNLVVYIV